MREETTLHLILRLVWFYFIGIPVGAVWLFAAWIACLTIIGLPIGIWMVHLAPAIMTLKQQDRFETFQVGERTAYIFHRSEQAPFLIRALYFIFIGWWLSAVWLKLSLLLAITFIGIPVSFWMINRLPFVMTLHED